MKLYECDNLNGAALYVFGETKAAVRKIVLNRESDFWAELRKTDFSRDDWNSKMRVTEIKPVSGKTCGVITY